LPTTLPELRFSFLRALDPIDGEPTKIACIGGFAVTQHYGSPRMTVNLDVIDVALVRRRQRLPVATKRRVCASTTWKLGKLNAAGVRL
jgi:hypothetical protein